MRAHQLDFSSIKFGYKNFLLDKFTVSKTSDHVDFQIPTSKLQVPPTQLNQINSIPIIYLNAIQIMSQPYEFIRT